MEIFWLAGNLILVLLALAAVCWQAITTTDYERRKGDDCADELDQKDKEILELKLKLERYELYLMGAGINIKANQVHLGDRHGGIDISGGTVTSDKDMVAGDETNQ